MSAVPMKLLLATDGSEDASLAARAAVEIAERSGSDLHLVHAWQTPLSRGYSTPTEAYLSKLHDDRAEELLEDQTERLRKSGVEVSGAYRRLGPPADEIVEIAGELEADLILVGSRGLGAVKRLVLGSVSEGVVHHASCPVLVLRGGDEAWPPRRVVIGDDGSETARKAGGLAAMIAGLFDAEVVLVRAYENPPEPIGGWSAQDRRELDEARLREEHALGERAGELESAGKKRPEARLIDTEPTLAMLLAAEDDEEGTLLALGSRGLGAARRALLGSVSTKVLRVARGPVLVCPPARIDAVL